MRCATRKRSRGCLPWTRRTYMFRPALAVWTQALVLGIPGTRANASTIARQISAEWLQKREGSVVSSRSEVGAFPPR
jgi:hypothetical protein